MLTDRRRGQRPPVDDDRPRAHGRARRGCVLTPSPRRRRPPGCISSRPSGRGGAHARACAESGSPPGSRSWRRRGCSRASHGRCAYQRARTARLNPSWNRLDLSDHGHQLAHWTASGSGSRALADSRCGASFGGLQNLMLSVLGLAEEDGAKDRAKIAARTSRSMF